MERFIDSNPNVPPGVKYHASEISYEKLIKTIAHELAHAYQYTINLKKEGEKSNCESSGEKDAEEKDEEEEFGKLITLLKGSKDLLDLEKNYRAVKKSPFYSEIKNTLGGKENNKQLLDSYYAKKTINLKTSETNSPNNNSYFNGYL
nr:12354_t:CDS:2 [Entrophospora candida]